MLSCGLSYSKGGYKKECEKCPSDRPYTGYYRSTKESTAKQSTVNRVNILIHVQCMDIVAKSALKTLTAKAAST